MDHVSTGLRFTEDISWSHGINNIVNNAFIKNGLLKNNLKLTLGKELIY